MQGPGAISHRQQGNEHMKAADSKKAEVFKDYLVEFANEQGVAIDVLAVGMPPEETPTLGNLATECGGLLLLQKGVHSFPPFHIYN